MTSKKDFQGLLVLVIISAGLLFNLFNQGIYGSHDGEIHVARIAQSREALEDAQLPVRWLENLNFGFGYPAFVYTYSAPYYVSSLLSILIPNFEIIFKTLMFTSVVISAMTFYFFASNSVSRFAAFIGSIFYITAPYRFADIYERGALGEALSFIFIPLMFIAPYVIIKKTFLGFIFSSLIVFAFITIHALTLLIFLPAQILFSILIFGRQIDKYKILVLAIVFGFFLASFQWLPMIFEQQYIDLNKTYFNIFEGHFLTIYQLLRIPKENVNIGTGIQLGIAQMAILILSVIFVTYRFVKTKKIDKLAAFFLVGIFAASFLILDVSKSLWYNIKPLTTIIFPWRFLTFTTFASAYLATSLTANTKTFKKQLIVTIVATIVAIYPIRHYVMGKYWHTFPNDYYANYQDPYKLDNYYLPKGVTKQLDKLMIPTVSIVEGKGSISVIEKKSNHLEVMTDLQEPSLVQFHTIDFPGWQLYIDGQRSEIITNYPGLEGIIVADVPNGTHNLRIEFTETSLRKFANLLSLGSFLFLVLVIMIRFPPISIIKKYHAS